MYKVTKKNSHKVGESKSIGKTTVHLKTTILCHLLGYCKIQTNKVCFELNFILTGSHG